MANNVITYYVYDLMTLQLLAELPFANVTWGQKLNDAGQFAGELLLTDPRVRALDPYSSTRPGRTLLAIDVNGDLAWLGIIWTRRYSNSSGKLSVSGSEIWSYFGSRLQARDYSNATGTPPSGNPGPGFWHANIADPQMVAACIIADALGLHGSAWAGAGSYGTLCKATYPFPGTALSWLGLYITKSVNTNEFIAPSYPLSQRQTVQSIVQTLSSMGYGEGFDFGVDVSWSGGSGSVPQAQLTFSYPRRGRVAGTTGLTLDIAAATDWEWPEDATQAANLVVATASSSGTANLKGAGPSASTPIVVTDSGPANAGYPLLEGTVSYSAINTQDVLLAAANGDLAAQEWPLVIPQVTVPVFGDPFVGDFIMGDDVRVIMPPNDRFQSGFDQYMRIVANDVRIPTEGVSTMMITLNMPVGAAPVPSPPI